MTGVLRKNIWLFVSIDILVICASLYLSYALRFDFVIPAQYFNDIQYVLIILLFSKISTFLFFNLYKGMWRFTSISDLINVVKSSSVASLFSLAVIVLVLHQNAAPRSVLLIDFLLTTVGIAGTRASVRIYGTKFSRRHKVKNNFPSKIKTRLLLLGAGSSGEKIIREVKENPSSNYKIIGLLDDDPNKINSTIHGIPVLGKIEALHTILIPFDEILICAPTATSIEMRSIVNQCKVTGKPYRTIPTVYELIDKQISIKTIREVSMTDLLGRQEVHLDRSRISNYIYGKRVLVTGAGGSIGSELVKQCLGYNPDLLILFDQSEHNLFKIDNLCKEVSDNVGIQPILGDIRDRHMVNSVFNSFQPQVVLHAAAYKHVPMQENNPWEAVITNVYGTSNVIEACENSHVERFVLVSTDKAVNPTNIMGATKRVVEILIQSKSKNSNVKYMAVRFGNVIGSSGSVIPTFQEQINKGGPITITDPLMKRYFMSIPEAAQLILQAGSIGEGGEIFVLDMGEPVLVKDIAYELIKLSGLEPEVDILIKYIGLRPGEKMFEELVISGENIVDTSHEKIMVLKNGIDHSWDHVLSKIEEITQSAKSYDSNIIKNKLKEFVPEYQPSEKDEILRLSSSGRIVLN
ncbi:MAG: polysaccharide biosynthesis protein [Candidatus Marinimicrobia bacterium]|nr:polysaccharide biosynthesis protein [Candidatus Neomarinimicrobiota bacterium]